MKGRTFTTLDSYIAGFLVLRGHHPDLISHGGKVVFAFKQSDSLLQAISAYHTGAEVPASVLASSIKALKGQIHDMRREKGIHHGTRAREKT